MSSAARDRLHPELWDKIKTKWHQGAKGGLAGKWNARKAQLAVLEYKRESRRLHGDSGYRNKKPGKTNSLVKWTGEDWGFAGAPGKSRYLPRQVRDRLTPAERRRENRRKGARLGEKVAWTPSVTKKMREAGVL